MALKSQTLQAVETWKGKYELASNGKTDTSPEKKILKMISDFQNFCDEYSTEIYTLAGRQPPDDQLEKDLEGVRSAYWKPIVGVVEQNQDPGYDSLRNMGYAQLDSFQQSMTRRLRLNLDDHIVLYFEEEGGKAIRFPFGSIRMIGVPMRDVSGLKKDWLAIPHELGHHLYWNARFSDTDSTYVPAPGTNFLAVEINASVEKYAKKITNRTPEQRKQIREYVQKMLDDWTEEIFADVVGTRIAQNQFIYAAWERVKRMVPPSEKRDELFISDGEHPIPYLLPYIRAYAMNFDPKPFVDWAKYKYPGEQIGGIDKYHALISDDDTSHITISTLRDDAIKTFVQRIVERLKTLEIEDLLKGSSPVAELKRFITSVNPDIESNEEMLKALLRPIILEKDEYWICAKGHSVRGRAKKCPKCKARRWPWSPRYG